MHRKPLPLVALAVVSAATHLVADDSVYRPVQCAGYYPGHLQGVAVDGTGAIYWSFTTVLVKTDSTGQVQLSVDVASHHGDLTHIDGQLLVAVNLGQFNQPAGAADSWIYVYRADDLQFVAKHPVAEVVHGAGGMAHDGDRVLVVGGLTLGTNENYLYEYDRSFQFIKRHVLDSGYTVLGIQTAEFAGGRWWFGCYGSPKQLLVVDRDLNLESRSDFDASLGIVAIGADQFLVAGGGKVADKGHTGRLMLATPKKGVGLELISSDR